jgi:protein tyrosine phosphatase (PTP) superfamily phosphohydrolase (DUF442 family)
MRVVFRLGLVLIAACAGFVAWRWDDLREKKVRVVSPGKLVRGAWQRPGPLKAILEREGIRTIVTLTAINRDDPKYVAQSAVVDEAGVNWVIVPLRGSTASLDEMAQAADLLADPARQPVFFHCVGGHHRTGLVHAAYRIRHEGWTAERAWRELAELPWTRPDQDADDRRKIEAFAAREEARRKAAGGDVHETREVSQGGQDHRRGPAPRGPGDRGPDRPATVRG